MKTFLLFFIVCVSFSAQAYRAQGVENIRNLNSYLKKAEAEGLRIPTRERAVKREFQKLQKKSESEFKAKLENKFENSTQLQGYLFEIRDGLAKTEKAKQVAKLVVFEKVKEDWDILKTTVLNSFGTQTFEQFKPKLVEKLNQAVYVPAKDGFSFEVADWAIVLVLPSLQTVRWKIQFNSKYDGNTLEEGAEKIKVQDKGSSSNSEFDF